MAIWSKQNYLNKEISHIINSPIREYDMTSGGFSILKRSGVLDATTIANLESMDKYSRNVYIGKLQRSDKALGSLLMDGFKEGIRLFIEENKINEESILSIKKDAIYVVNKNASILDIDGYNFRLDNLYTSYYYLNNKEFYFSGNDKSIEVKGLSADILEKHKPFFLKELASIFNLAERSDKKTLLRYIRAFRRNYLDMELELETYRELNAYNSFRLTDSLANSPVFLDSADDDTDIEIGYNYIQYIVPLIKLYV